MPLVKITPYECERNLFPRLCAKCGVPAAAHVRFTPLGPAGNVAMGTWLSLCPPLFVISAMCIRRWRPGVLLPMCERHKADWEWLDRVTSYSYLLLAVVPYCAATVLAGFVVGWSDPGLCILCFVGYFFVWCVWVVPAAIMWTRTVRSTGIPRRGLQLSGVHSDFVRALAEDRVRDANPERTAWFGDHRDDFDEDMSWQQSVRNDPASERS